MNISKLHVFQILVLVVLLMEAVVPIVGSAKSWTSDNITSLSNSFSA